MNAIIRTLLLIVMSALACGAAAQTTSFTYQGQLKDGASLAEGQHDFRFRLFDSASGNAQLGTTQCVDNIQVRDGVFTTTIDFGNQFTTSTQRFIEIDVRRDTGLNCSNTTGYTTLAPRQPITPAPTATQAASAFSLASPDGSHSKAVFVGNNGFAGIGTTTPGFPLHIAGPFAVLGLQDTGPNSLQAGYVSYRNGTGTETAWAGFGTAGDPDFSIVNARTGGDIVLNPFSGNVGIGTASPAARLEVRGDIRLGPTGQFRAASGEENLRVIRGKISFTGGVALGLGFTAARISEGHYKVTFTTPFASTPCVTLTSHNAFASDVNTYVASFADGPFTTSFEYRVQIDGGGSTDRDVDFIAVGPR